MHVRECVCVCVLFRLHSYGPLTFPSTTYKKVDCIIFRAHFTFLFKKMREIN